MSGPEITRAGGPRRVGALGRRGRRRRSRRLALGALALAAVAVVLLADRGPSYTVHARFANAGQLVKGGLVEVGGVKIGTIRSISMADGGQADIAMAISDERFVPLRRGTRATIRSVGQATITNRYVDLGPGPQNAPALPTGSVLPASDTTGIVDLDAILNAVDPAARRALQGLLANSAKIYAGSGAREFNATLARLDPAMARVGGLLRELADDRPQIAELVRTGARTAQAVADRRPDLQAAIQNTATTMRALADQRQSLSSVLQRAPRVLRQASGTLERTAATAVALRPTLRRVPAVQPGLRTLLRRLPKTLGRAQQPLRQLNGLLEPLRTALQGVQRLEPPAVAALKSTATGFRSSMDVLEGLRFYGSDLLLGVVNGLTGISSGQYNQFGHYLKLEFIQSPQTAVGGVLAPIVTGLLDKNGALPGIFSSLTDQRSRCPGSNAPPAADGSNPWYPKAGICDPRQSMSALVNSPTALCRRATDCEGDRRSLEPDPEPAARARRRGSR